MRNFLTVALPEVLGDNDIFRKRVKEAESRLQQFYETHPNASHLVHTYNERSGIVTLTVYDGGAEGKKTYPKKVFLDVLTDDRTGEELSKKINAFYHGCENEGYTVSKIQTVDCVDGILYLIFADKEEPETDDEDNKDDLPNGRDSLLADDSDNEESDDLFPLA